VNPTFEYENLDHVLICRSTERRSANERRSGMENRASELVKNKNLRKAVERLELSSSLDNTKFICEFSCF
jgi:hypothetical protein